MQLLIFYVLLALGVSFLCSVMEAVILSVTPSFVAAQQATGSRTGQRLKRLKDDIDRPLAAILSLNTIAHTMGAAGAGGQAAAIFGEAYIGVISAILTLLILILSEIVPKTLGALYWRQLTPTIVAFLVPVTWSMWPLVVLAQGITRLLSGGKRKTLTTREEIEALAELGVRHGVLEAEESRVLRNLFNFRSLYAEDIMTPRTVIFMLDETDKVKDVLEAHPELRFSRIPIYREQRDDVTGYVLKDELLRLAAEDQGEEPVGVLKRKILAVPEKTPLPLLFEQLLGHHEHIALVVNEEGGTAGIVTQEDVVETLLGMEIVDEADSVQDMRELARRQWLRRARRLRLVADESEEETRRR